MPSSSVICTLAEKHYLLGVGVLANSLYRSGFRGDFFCGYRGALPSWAAAAKKVSEGRHLLRAADGLDLHFLSLETPTHFALHKPRFMLDLLSGPAKGASQIFYLDPDIVVKGGWPFFEIWPHGGVALCEDLYAGHSGYLPEGHPLRLRWAEWAGRNGFPILSSRDRYFNSGFIGVESSQAAFLGLWERITKAACAEIGTDTKINFGGPQHLFYLTDQHALNLALMASTVKVNAAGVEAMDFASGGFLLSHAVRSPKPWQGGFLKRALFGKKPTGPERHFVRFLDSPLRVFPPLRSWWLKASLKLAREISRL